MVTIKWTSKGEDRMNRDTRAFRGKVVEEYGTVSAFAEAMHWSPRKASYVTTGRQDMTAEEIENCAEALHVDNVQDFMRIFYPLLSIKWTA